MNLSDRGKGGSKQHLFTGATGTPLTSAITAANTHDGLLLLPLLDRFPHLRGRRGRPRAKPLLGTADIASPDVIAAIRSLPHGSVD